jgi:hypothetical protein
LTILVVFFSFISVINILPFVNESIFRLAVILLLATILMLVTPKMVMSVYGRWHKGALSIYMWTIPFIVMAIILMYKFIYEIDNSLNLLEAGINTMSLGAYLLGLLFVVGCIIATSLVIGERVLTLLHIRCTTAATYIIAFGLGQTVIAYTVFALGVLGLLYTWLAYCGIALIFVLERRRVVSYMKYTVQSQLSLHRVTHSITGADRRILSLALTMVVLAVISMLVMVMNSLTIHPYVTDTLRSYMSLPHIYAEEHMLVNYDGSSYNPYPKNAEMIFTLGFLLLDHNVANFVVLVYMVGSVWLLVLLWKIIIPKERRRGPPAIVFYLFLIPSIMAFGYGNPKVDIFLLFYTILLVYIAIVSIKKESFTPWVVLMGLFAGMLLGIKYTAAISVAAVFLALPILYQGQWKRVVTMWIFGSAIALALFAPWGARNMAVIGNPVAPFLWEKFDTGESIYTTLGEDSHARTIQSQRDSSYYQLFNQEEKGLKYYISLPLRVVANQSGLIMRLNDMGPIFIGLAFLLLLRKLYSERRRLFLMTMVGIHFFAYLLIVENTVLWYILPVFALLLVAFEIALSEAKRDVHVLVYRLVLVVAFMALLVNTRIYPFSMIMPAVAEIDMSERGDYSHSRFEQLRDINLLLSSDTHSQGKVHFMNDSAVYFFDDFHHRIIPALYMEVFGYLYDKGMTNEEITEKFEELNVRYLLVNRGQFDVNIQLLDSIRGHSPNISSHYGQWYQAFDRYAEAELRAIYSGSVYTLYEITDEKL